MILSFKKTVLLAASISLLSSLCAQPQLIEKVEARPDGLVIPYEKYKLPNGLTIIIHEDHSDPIVSVSVTYKVGSARESIGKSGFAHFFEHMMFQGSAHVKDEEHFKIVSEAGGDMNGFTQRDKTVYYETLPSNQLEVALWLESDRMGFLLDSLTSKKFENQRDAVKNEKGQNVENQPYGMADELLGQTLYPFKHPYSWSVIGYTDDLNRANLQDVKNFFLRWYGPNNAILAVSGDVDTKETLKLIEKYFATIKSGPEVKKAKVPLPTLPGDKYASYKDNIYLPLNMRVFPTVPLYHRDEPALDLMADMMGDGNNSIFYKNFVKSKLAIQANVSNSASELAGEFALQVVAYPPEDFNLEKMFNDLDAKVKTTIEEFEKTGVTDEALARAKAKTESQIIDGVTSAFGKAMLISEWERLLGRPFNLNDEIDRYSKVTKEDIARVFNKYIKGAGAAVVNVYPKFNSKDSVKSVNPYAGMELKDDPEYAGLTYTHPVDNFDRSKKPQASTPKLPKVPDFYTSTLKNGLKIIGTKTAESPKVILLLEILGGNMVLSNDEVKKVGIAELTGMMMNEGTKNYTTEQISAELEKLGSSIRFGANKQRTQIVVECLKKNLDATLKLFNEKLTQPVFNEEDFKRAKKQFKESLRDQKTNPNAIANIAYNSLIFGANTILGSVATSKTVDKLELSDVKSYYEKYYSPSVSNLVIAGDISESEIMPKLDFLNNWKAIDVKIPTVTMPALPAETQIYIVEKAFAPQSIIVAGHTSLPYDATGDFYKNTIVNYPFGGAFNSRLNLNLREDKGYTYGIRSGFNGSKYAGIFSVSASVKRAATGAALDEIMKELNGYLNGGMKEEELNFTKSSILNSEALEYETPYQKAQFLSNIISNNLPKDYTNQQMQILKNMSKADVDNQAKKHIHAAQLVIVIVGDKDIVKKQLEKYNFTKVKSLSID